jgi:hypothetical protein
LNLKLENPPLVPGIFRDHQIFNPDNAAGEKEVGSPGFPAWPKSSGFY